MPPFLAHFVKDEVGAALVEYGVLLALITALLIGLVNTLANEVGNMFQTVVTLVGG